MDGPQKLINRPMEEIITNALRARATLLLKGEHLTLPPDAQREAAMRYFATTGLNPDLQDHDGIKNTVPFELVDAYSDE